MTKSGKGTLEHPGKHVQKQANQNRSLLDVSPRMIRTMLEYKAPWYGSRKTAPPCLNLDTSPGGTGF